VGIDARSQVHRWSNDHPKDACNEGIVDLETSTSWDLEWMPASWELTLGARHIDGVVTSNVRSL